MREYAKFCDVWTDFEGGIWPVIQSLRRLNFKYPAHAALRRHIFHRDAYACVRCDAMALFIPEKYDGHKTLHTNTIISSGYRDVLILDHILTLRAGGRNIISNFQTLCETCNKRKQKEDIAAAKIFRGEQSNG